MHLLHERSVCVNKPSGSQHAVNLIYHALRIEDMLEYRLYQDPIHGAIRERDLVRIRDELTLFTPIYIESQKI
jgi:hypothetical protein